MCEFSEMKSDRSSCRTRFGLSAIFLKLHHTGFLSCNPCHCFNDKKKKCPKSIINFVFMPTTTVLHLQRSSEVMSGNKVISPFCKVQSEMKMLWLYSLTGEKRSAAVRTLRNFSPSPSLYALQNSPFQTLPPLRHLVSPTFPLRTNKSEAAERGVLLSLQSHALSIQNN